MKILFVHNYYQQAGGEDNVVAAEQALLRTRGHDVRLWAVDNKNISHTLFGKFNIAMNTAYSRVSRRIAFAELNEFRPDLVHVHNFFPQISPSIYDACIDAGVPVVQTLHNYRLICPGAMLMRQGNICENCVTGSPYQAVWYGCYRHSRMGSFAVAHMVAEHRRKGTWQHKVNRFIALTEFSKNKYIEAGFPGEKISVKANFLDDPFLESVAPARNDSSFALFVGRISAEKGIDTLLDAWSGLNNGMVLKVAGTGPLADRVQGRSFVEALGRLQPKEISHLMRHAAFLVLPSEWYEGFPLVILEAFAHGLPVLASGLGSMTDIIQNGVNGLCFKSGDCNDLRDKIQYLARNPQIVREMGRMARQTYLTKYTAADNFRQLMAIYEQTVRNSLVAE